MLTACSLIFSETLFCEDFADFILYPFTLHWMTVYSKASTPPYILELMHRNDKIWWQDKNDKCLNTHIDSNPHAS